jgi:hypothetical protein
MEMGFGFNPAQPCLAGARRLEWRFLGGGGTVIASFFSLSHLKRALERIASMGFNRGLMDR